MTLDSKINEVRQKLLFTEKLNPSDSILLKDLLRRSRNTLHNFESFDYIYYQWLGSGLFSTHMTDYLNRFYKKVILFDSTITKTEMTKYIKKKFIE